ncbi:MAG: MarR family transcriptional regulator [Leptospiraceae bacterium]|nr:MarR family transcriptional regulator [Leptospiraceae bacterium]MDW8306910.1 helix-turn-helix domain-containing protein [Leptospiraceae bacterium]
MSELGRERIYLYLERLSRALRHYQNEVAFRHELSALQLQILLSLLRVGKATPGFLSKDLQVSYPTISDAVRTLEKKGFVVASLSGEDARQRPVELSEMGFILAQDLQKEVMRPWDLFSEQEEETRTLVVLHELVARLFANKALEEAPVCMTCCYFEKKGRNYFCHLLQKSMDAFELKAFCPDHKALS